VECCAISNQGVISRLLQSKMITVVPCCVTHTHHCIQMQSTTSYVV